MDILLSSVPQLITTDGKSFSPSELNVDYICFYFSGHWCPPCRQFTPVLKEFYDEAKAQGKSFEIIFVSSDHDNASFLNYFKTMPWVAIPFDNQTARNALGSHFSVSGIPSFIILRSDGTIITKNGRSFITQNPKAAIFFDQIQQTSSSTQKKSSVCAIL